MSNAPSAMDRLVPPPEAVDRWHLNLSFMGSGVYVATALAYPLQDHAEYSVDRLLAVSNFNEHSSFVVAELSVLQTGAPTFRGAGSGAAAVSGPPREHVGLSVRRDGDSLVGPYWFVDNPLGFDGFGANSHGPVPTPPMNETQTLVLVVAYATFPDDDHPLPATVDFLVTSPEPNLVPQETYRRGGGVGAYSYFRDEVHGKGYSLGLGETKVAAESDVALEFATSNDTLVMWYAYVPGAPRVLDFLPTGQMNLTVTNSTGANRFDMGVGRSLQQVEQWYVQPGGEEWRFRMNVTGRADLFVAYADAPFLRWENWFMCNRDPQLQC